MSRTLRGVHRQSPPSAQGHGSSSTARTRSHENQRPILSTREHNRSRFDRISAFYESKARAKREMFAQWNAVCSSPLDMQISGDPTNHPLDKRNRRRTFTARCPRRNNEIETSSFFCIFCRGDDGLINRIESRESTFCGFLCHREMN